MIILSHRGYWKKESEKNSLEAFERSFSLGYGTETDIRDYKGELVISHDIPTKTSLSLESFFKIYKKINSELPLALNIKSDGLQIELKKLLKSYDIKNYFVFDMSVPDGLQYIREEINSFTRQSEYEKNPSFYELADGVWLDEFKDHWIDEETINTHYSNEKKICIVSPDLHKRSYENEWEHYKKIVKRLERKDLMICTDYPCKAKEFFNE